MKTKVLYVAMKFDYGDKSRGISFEHRNFHDSLKTYAAKQDWDFIHYDFLSRTQEIGQAAMTEELFETAKREEPTVLFAVLCDPRVDPNYEVFERISGLGTVTVHWFCDDHWRFDGYSSFVAPNFDLVCTTATSALPKYEQLGLSDRVIKTQWACNHEIYVPCDIPRDIDCSFVGMPHGDRVNVVNSLMSRGLDVQIYGYGWQDRPRLPFNQMVRMFSRSKVNLNLSNSAVSSVQQIKGRNFEVPGCRAFLLTAKAEELESYYEDGREVVTYDTLDELVEKARYYAAHDEEREAIAQNAYARTLAEHTWHHRYDVVFEKALVAQPRPYVAPALTADTDFLPGSGKPNFTSIIILNLNGAKHIHDCIDSLRRYTKPAHEIIVVDNGSTDDSLDYLRALPFVKLIENKENVGVGLGRNQGLAVAEGEYIVFLDNDTIVTDAWLDRFINYAKADQSIGMMGPRSNYVSGPQIVPEAKYSSFEDMQAFAADWASKNSMQATLVGRLVGFCQFMRRAVIKKVGGTEPAFGLWGWDDDDLSLRAQLAGYKLAMANEIYIHHTGSQTSKTADLNYNELLVEKWEIFRQKWGFSWTPGQPMAYSVEQILMRRFDPNKHGIALPTREEIEKLLFNRTDSQSRTVQESSRIASSSLVEDLLMTKRWDDAIEAINEHLKSNPDDARSLNKLGMAYHGKGDDKSARNAVRRSIDADPTYADAYYGMAQLLLNDNRAIEAADYAIKAAGFGVPHYGAMKTLEDCRKALRTVKQSTGKKQGKKAKNTSVAVADIDTRLRKLGEMIECVATQPQSNTGPKQTITLCMIARNEEDMIGDCLASARDLVDEIIVVDTGSTDRTVQIATTYGAKITNFEWNDCFADARNVAIEQATSDWVLVLDADERLDDNARNQIAQAISNSETDAYELAFVNYMTGANTPDVHISRCVRLFRNRSAYRYTGRIHERIAPAIQNTGGIIRLLEAVIHHHGYRPEIVKERGKHQRNLNLLEKDLADSPQDVYVIYHLANQYYTEGNHAKAVEYFEQCVPLVLPTHQFKPLLFSNLADCYMALGQLQDAIKAIDNASLLRAYHPQLLHSKGNTFRLAGNYPLAVDSYEAAIELGKRGLWDGDTTTFGYKAHYGAAASYLAIGHYTMAIEHAEKALLSRQENPESKSILAQAKDALAANGGQNKEVYESSRTQVHSGDNPKLSLCMIVKDEEEFLKGCLNSARPIVDEIIVVDTGSQDRTVEIATECGANVHYFPWNDSFADARNESLNHATGDWILILDADELLDDGAPAIILDAIKNPTADAYEMFFRNPIGEEKDSDYTEHRICRLFRNKPEYRFNSRIHENIETAVGQNHGTIGQLQAVIHHMGYVQRLIVERNKGERYTKILEQEVAEHPGNIFYMHHLIAAYCAYGQFEKALENLFVATEIAELNNPFTPILWATLVNILVELGRPDEALDAAERSETRGVYQHPQLHFCKANAYTRLERYQEAVDSYKKAIEEGRGKTWNGDTQTAGYKADYGIGNSYQKMNRNDEAIPYLLKVIDTKPNHIAANEALTKAYSATNQMDKYEKQLAVLQTLVPKDPGPSIRLAELCEGRQEIDKARDIYMNIIANIEDTAVLEFKLGSFHEALGDNESAEKCYLRAIEILPECKDAHSNLGLLLASQGRLEEALDSFVKAIDIDPNYANAYFNAGDVLYQAGLYEQSLDIYSNGLEIIPDHVPAFFAVGNCYFQLGAYEAAAVAYRETLKLEPGHTGATNNLSLAEAALQEAPVESETPEASNVA